MKYDSVFKSAVMGTDGEVDAGYLALFWVMVTVLGAIPFMCTVTLGLALWGGGKFDAQGLGIGIGSVCTGAGVVIGAVGAFRAGDKDPAPRWYGPSGERHDDDRDRGDKCSTP